MHRNRGQSSGNKARHSYQTSYLGRAPRNRPGPPGPSVANMTDGFRSHSNNLWGFHGAPSGVAGPFLGRKDSSEEDLVIERGPSYSGVRSSKPKSKRNIVKEYSASLDIESDDSGEENSAEDESSEEALPADAFTNQSLHVDSDGTVLNRHADDSRGVGGGTAVELGSRTAEGGGVGVLARDVTSAKSSILSVPMTAERRIYQGTDEVTGQTNCPSATSNAQIYANNFMTPPSTTGSSIIAVSPAHSSKKKKPAGTSTTNNSTQPNNNSVANANYFNFRGDTMNENRAKMRARKKPSGPNTGGHNVGHSSTGISGPSAASSTNSSTTSSKNQAQVANQGQGVLVPGTAPTKMRSRNQSAKETCTSTKFEGDADYFRDSHTAGFNQVQVQSGFAFGNMTSNLRPGTTINASATRPGTTINDAVRPRTCINDSCLNTAVMGGGNEMIGGNGGGMMSGGSGANNMDGTSSSGNNGSILTSFMNNNLASGMNNLPSSGVIGGVVGGSMNASASNIATTGLQQAPTFVGGSVEELGTVNKVALGSHLLGSTANAGSNNGGMSSTRRLPSDKNSRSSSKDSKKSELTGTENSGNSVASSTTGAHPGMPTIGSTTSGLGRSSTASSSTSAGAVDPMQKSNSRTIAAAENDTRNLIDNYLSTGFFSMGDDGSRDDVTEEVIVTPSSSSSSSHLRSHRESASNKAQPVVNGSRPESARPLSSSSASSNSSGQRLDQASVSVGDDRYGVKLSDYKRPNTSGGTRASSGYPLKKTQSEAGIGGIVSSSSGFEEGGKLEKLDRVAMIEQASRALRERYYNMDLNKQERPESRKGSRNRGLQSSTSAVDTPGNTASQEGEPKRLKRPPSRKKDPSRCGQPLFLAEPQPAAPFPRLTKRPPSRHKEPPKALHLVDYEQDCDETIELGNDIKSIPNPNADVNSLVGPGENINNTAPSDGTGVSFAGSNGASGLSAMQRSGSSRWAQLVADSGESESEILFDANNADSGGRTTNASCDPSLGSSNEAATASSANLARSGGHAGVDSLQGGSKTMYQSSSAIHISSASGFIPWQAATTTGWMQGQSGKKTNKESGKMNKEEAGSRALLLRPSSSAALSRSNKESKSHLQVEDLDNVATNVPTIVCNSRRNNIRKVPFSTSLDHDFLELFAT